MFRALLATLIVSALVLKRLVCDRRYRLRFGPRRLRTVAAAGKQSPLPPGGAAGIEEAQGIEGDLYWLQTGLVIGAFVIIWVLMGIGDDSTKQPLRRVDNSARARRSEHRALAPATE